MTILLFGATGSAGGSVLRVCLESPAVASVRAIVRRPLAVSAAKLTVVLRQNFADHAGAEATFAGVDACFYCLGKSAQQVKDEASYRRITHDFAIAAARALRQQSPTAAFHFLSGHGASLTSSVMWARVKAETERDGAPCS
ncbi:MAG: NmrA family NAD(P)-binding protein [Vicinamibacterales bacterium]|mgnify:CR=1 FL=1